MKEANAAFERSDADTLRRVMEQYPERDSDNLGKRWRT